ncbi:hypothetical protein LFM09_46170 [Lentzea alba]|uniref:hypothetical protein n=1 Tax=Lentzea alba TaxID=2714351 RepID=UPI0039BFED46
MAGDHRVRVPQALAKVPADTVETARKIGPASLQAEGVTELDATTLIGSGCRAT